MRVLPTTQKHFEILKTLENDGFDFWQRPKLLGTYADIMVPSENKPKLEALFKDLGMEYNIMIDNVETYIIIYIQKLQHGFCT